MISNDTTGQLADGRAVPFRNLATKLAVGILVISLMPSSVTGQAAPNVKSNFANGSTLVASIEEELERTGDSPPETGSYSTSIADLNDPGPDYSDLRAERVATEKKFLTLPFLSRSFRFQAGWYYGNTVGKNWHGAIDYVNGKVDDNHHWTYFDVVAAAEGTACKSGTSNLVITHNVDDAIYQTRYSHLDNIIVGIPNCGSNNPLFVNRGQVVARASNVGVHFDHCGSPCIHLHFEVWRGTSHTERLDPYDLRAAFSSYPPAPGQGAGKMGANHLWRDDPPQTPRAPTINLYGYSNNQTVRVVAGRIQIGGIAIAHDGSSVGNVKYWVEGNNPRPKTVPSFNWDAGDDFEFVLENLDGLNTIVVEGCDDDEGCGTFRLNVASDRSGPTASASVVQGVLGKNGYYVSPVVVRIQADDQESGRGYLAGIKRLAYSVCCGQWTSVAGSPADVNVISSTAVKYYAVDMDDNQSSQGSLDVLIDTIAPSQPGGVIETNGVVAGVWQGVVGQPAFAWTSSSDAGSGVESYLVDLSGAFSGFTANSMFQSPSPLRTGIYTFTARAVDRAGNIGSKSSPFVFKYDSTPPQPPIPSHAMGVGSGVWQNETRIADFTWPVAVDQGAGVGKYYVYWGSDPNGTSVSPTSQRSFQSSEPIAPLDGVGTAYLRSRSEDGVGLLSQLSTYVLNFDGAPPSLTLTANYGLPVVRQTIVHLAMGYSDLGSGVDGVRLSTEGQVWTDWLSPTQEIQWEIPSVGRRSYSIYAQAHDLAGNVSSVVSKTVYLDINSPFPQSSNFFLWNSLMSSGGGHLQSSAWQQQVSVGESLESRPLSSEKYRLNGGLQAAALAIPTATVSGTIFILQNWVLAGGGTGAVPMSSASWSANATLGQLSQMGVLSSTNYSVIAGYWGALASTSTYTEPPEPAPIPLPDCEFYSISINDGAISTASPNVRLSACGPAARQMMLSNDGGFSSAVWQPYTTTADWTMTTYGSAVIPRIVYARFRDGQNQIFGNFMDDIIFDPTAPTGRVGFRMSDLLTPTNNLVWRPSAKLVEDTPVNEGMLYLVAQDDSTGVAAMQISESPLFDGATWREFAAIVPITPSAEGQNSFYTRFRDGTGNISQPSMARVIRDSTAPTGTVGTDVPVISMLTRSISLSIAAFDVGTGVSSMRIGHSEVLSDAAWVSYATAAAVSVLGDADHGTLFVQYRDGALNESVIYSATFLVDRNPPVVFISQTSSSDREITFTLVVTDDVSGVDHMEISADYDFLGAVETLPVLPEIRLLLTDTHKFIRFIDGVGNASQPYLPVRDDLYVAEEVDDGVTRVFLPLLSR